MSPKKLSDDLSVSAQIDPAEMADLAAAGYKSILCNRPDDEDAGQPSIHEVTKAAAAHGIEVRHDPVISGGMRPEDIDIFADALDNLPKPVLAYCRTGTRCTMLWAASQHGLMTTEDIIKTAAEAGYDVSGLMQRMDAR